MTHQKNFGLHFFAYGWEIGVKVFKIVLFPMGIPPPPSWGKTLIGALGPVVTQFYI